MKRGLCVLALVMMGGCAHARIHRTSQPDPSIGTIRQQTYKVAFLGLTSFTDPVNIAKACQDGWETLDTKVTFLQGVLRVVTLNLYSPFSVEVDCSTPRPAPKDEF